MAASAKPAVSLGEEMALEPDFAPRTTDYVARCNGAPLSVSVSGAKGWESRIGPGEYSKGDLDSPDEGTSAVVTARRASSDAKPRRYFVRCLPADFPEYEYTRKRKGGTELFTMQLTNAYAAIFNRDGIPLWWYQASGQPDNVEVLRDGTVAFAPVDATAAQSADYEIHNLKGKLLRTVEGAGGAIADIHELLLLPNGNYALGTATTKTGVDATAFGRDDDASVLGIELEEETPEGEVVWSWRSEDHIGLEETGGWWQTSSVASQPYDIVHWNSIDMRGNRVLLSFRHLDAVYALNRKTGEIVWKLGGTPTPESLTVSGDPKSPQIFGGQHDARFNADGSISVFDNRTGLNDAPRAVRYEVDEAAGTADLVETVSDPKVPVSFCCGSSRRDEDGDWLISWGGAATGGTVGAYDERGRNIFKLTTPVGFPYRALPVNERYADAGDLRKAMNSRKG